MARLPSYIRVETAAGPRYEVRVNPARVGVDSQRQLA